MTADAAPSMPQLLSEAKRWFDDALLSGMTAAGEQPVTAAQAAVFATLDPDGTSISELARRMGVTRFQTTHQAVHSLIGLGLLEQTPDPSSARSRIVRTTPAGALAHERAQIMLARHQKPFWPSASVRRPGCCATSSHGPGANRPCC